MQTVYVFCEGRAISSFKYFRALQRGYENKAGKSYSLTGLGRSSHLPAQDSSVGHRISA